MNGFQNLLIVISSPRQGLTALRKGIALALAVNAQPHIMILMHDTFGLESWQLALPSLKAIYEEEDRIRRQTERAVASIVSASCGPEVAVPVRIAEGPAFKEIRDYVRAHAIDLLVLPAHSESGLEQRLFGKLNEEIHRKLPCSVLFVKHEPAPLRQFVCLKANRLQMCEIGDE